MASRPRLCSWRWAAALALLTVAGRCGCRGCWGFVPHRHHYRRGGDSAGFAFASGSSSPAGGAQQPRRRQQRRPPARRFWLAGCPSSSSSAPPSSRLLCAGAGSGGGSSRSRGRSSRRRTLVLDRDDDAGGGGNGGGDRRSCRLASPAGAPRSAEEEDGAPFLSVPSSSSRGPPPPALSSALASALLAGTAAAAPPLLAPFAAAAAAAAADGGAPVISTGSLDPSGFVPVCPASDGFYRLLQGATEALVGRDAFVEYGPLIAGGLLRVRLELCVVESFANEAVVPFVRQNGLSWILPVHETVETFLAGTIFALAATFILIGSTKIVTIVATYADFLVGFPCRLLGGFSYDRALGKPVTLDVGIGPFKTRLVGPPLEGKAGSETGDGASGNGDDSDWSRVGAGNVLPVAASGTVKLVGIVLGFFREVLDGLDVFVGRYLVFWASFYILVKFLHFKGTFEQLFPDFP